MELEARRSLPLVAWEGLNRLRQGGIGLFAAGVSGFLLLLIGVPVGMVILMSLRTGFPGEDVPLTLENFVEVYLDPGTYEILLKGPVRSLKRTNRPVSSVV